MCFCLSKKVVLKGSANGPIKVSGVSNKIKCYTHPELRLELMLVCDDQFLTIKILAPFWLWKWIGRVSLNPPLPSNCLWDFLSLLYCKEEDACHQQISGVWTIHFISFGWPSGYAAVVVVCTMLTNQILHWTYPFWACLSTHLDLVATTLAHFKLVLYTRLGSYK